MNVIVAIDGSENSLRALRYVLTYAAVFGASPVITLVTVHLPLPTPRAKAWLGHEVIDQYYAEESEAILAPARVILKEHNQNAQEVVAVGDPGTEIAKAADSHGAQMIIMGTHGRSALGSLIMGSVANRTLAATNVPILLIK